MSQFKIELDLNVLNHLGIGLYSNTPAVLTEIVANGWDADASNVHIDLAADKNEIVIRDDGHGMSFEDIQKKFLTVGYARRKHGEEITPKGRQCMGRKGIGKLAMFSLANEIHVVSRKQGEELSGFIIDVNHLKSHISQGKDYHPTPISNFTKYKIEDTGTTIVLKDLNKRINKTESFLRRRLARRFSVIESGNDFNINLNKKIITIDDRGFYKDIQLLWTFGNAEIDCKKRCVNKVRHHHYSGELPNTDYKVNGFIGGVFKPEMLKKNDDNNNTITLMANGRIFVEDAQKSIDDSKVFNSYLVGELNVDFFDENESEDMAVSSRQGVNENDPRYETLLAYIKTRLSEIASKWTEWRRELGAEDIEDEFPKVTEWLETLQKKHRTKAKQLIGRTNTLRFSGTDDEQKQQKKELLRHQILAFEKMKIQDNIEEIDQLDIEKNVTSFNSLILSIEDIEASMHHDLLEQRLAVIKKLKDHTKNKVKERVVQDHIYQHLWLIDPTWEHLDKSTEQEKTLTEYLKRTCPDSTDGARLDIGYKTTAGRYVVIELKKPGLPSINAEILISQGEKYYMALKQYFRDNPGSCPSHGVIPTIDIVFLVDKNPIKNDGQKELLEPRLKTINGKIITYNDLINQASEAYQEHLTAIEKIDKIRGIVDGL
jgi:hypothetical protein